MSMAGIINQGEIPALCGETIFENKSKFVCAAKKTPKEILSRPIIEPMNLAVPETRWWEASSFIAIVTVIPGIITIKEEIMTF